ncbi:MAG: tight adherence protein B [Chloroflexi bacterium]|nr:MAG: tight adherence protein B [Chloroflexota bacterium]MBA4374971.1 secretion system protein [Anaerolinea sp.]
MDPVIILWVGGALILILIGVGIYVSISSRRSVEEDRLGEYVEPEISADTKKREAPTPVTDWLTKRVEKSNFGDKLGKELAQADLKLKPGEFIALMAISSFASAVFGWFIGTQNLLLGVVGAVLGLFLPRMYVRSQKKKRLIKFNEQLGDMLGLMVNGLRAGYSVMQAMEAVSKELPSPISDEFRRVVQEIQLGVLTEKALDNLLRRIPSDDLDLVITAMNVQREVGGNLAEILDTISHTIRERVRLKGEIRVLTAQMDISALFLSLLPVGLVFVLYLINREYIIILVSKESNQPFPCGFAALGLAGLMIISGYFVIKKIANIEV